MNRVKLAVLIPSPAYNSEKHVEAFQNAIDIQVKEIQATRDDFKLQCRPATATWGMANYERAWGLLVDESKPLEQRLAMYRAKRRGMGTTTTAVLKNIAKSFCEGEVDVIEHKREFWFEIIFINDAPLNLKDLQAIIEEIKPAHMEDVYGSESVNQVGVYSAGPAHDVYLPLCGVTLCGEWPDYASYGVSANSKMTVNRDAKGVEFEHPMTGRVQASETFYREAPVPGVGPTSDIAIKSTPVQIETPYPLAGETITSEEFYIYVEE